MKLTITCVFFHNTSRNGVNIFSLEVHLPIYFSYDWSKIGFKKMAYSTIESKTYFYGINLKNELLMMSDQIIAEGKNRVIHND